MSLYTHPDTCFIGTCQKVSISASVSKLTMAEHVHFVNEGCHNCLEKANLEKSLSLMDEEKKRSRENVEHLLSSLKQAQNGTDRLLCWGGRWEALKRISLSVIGKYMYTMICFPSVITIFLIIFPTVASLLIALLRFEWLVLQDYRCMEKFT